MKRWLGWGVLIAACSEGSAAPVASRVEAVAAKPLSASAAELCDSLPKRDAAPVFKLPELDGPAPASKGARWINVWATWCPPCVEELPVLRRMEKKLAAQGTPVNLSLLSVDATAEAVTTFQAQHPEATGSLRIRDEAQLESWLTSIGLDRGATLPVHVFVRADDKVACVRTGAIKETDLPAVRALLGS